MPLVIADEELGLALIEVGTLLGGSLSYRRVSWSLSRECLGFSPEEGYYEGGYRDDT